MAGVAFIVGALVLFNRLRCLQRGALLVVGTGIFLGVLFPRVMMLAPRPARASVISTANLPGLTGIARTDLAGEGTVQIGGELWTARPVHGSPPIHKGERIEVVSSEGLVLTVRKRDAE